MKTSIQFRSENQIVQGKFYSAPSGSVKFPTLLLLTGFPGNEDDVLGLGEVLSQHRINILTFNYRGIYQSEGEYSLRNTQVDIQAAFDFLKDDKIGRKYQIDSEKLVLGGWSYGGGMGLIYAANHPEVRHVFSISGTDHGEFAREYQRNEQFSTLVDSIFEELKYPDGPVNFLGKEAIRRELIQNPEPYDLLNQATHLANRDILLIGGWDDTNVVLENHLLPFYRELKSIGSNKVRIIGFQDNHAFEKSRLELANSLLKWIGTLF
jgi:pimeloyl-ACP methyl ester carboxylesterase